MIKQPANIDELYAFFMPNLIKPPSRHGCISSGDQLDRPGWHIEIYGISSNDAMYLWFYSHPYREPKWVMRYDIFTNPSQES